MKVDIKKLIFSRRFQSILGNITLYFYYLFLYYGLDYCCNISKIRRMGRKREGQENHKRDNMCAVS